MTSATVVLGVLSALGDGGETCGPGDAKAHIAKGHELSDHRNELGALAEYRCAYRLKASAEALAQIGLAEMALGRWVEAESDLDRALAQKEDPWIREKGGEFAEALEKIRDNLGDLFIDGSPTGAEVLIDGRKAARLPIGKALRVPTGRIEIHMRADGYQPVTRERRIEARRSARETIDLVPLESSSGNASVAPPISASPGVSTPAGPAPATSISDRPEAEPSRWPAWAAAGVAAVSLAAGVGFHIVRELDARDFNQRAECDIVPRTKDCADLSDDTTRAGRFAIAGYAGAAVFGALSIYLFLSPPGNDGKKRAHALVCGPDLAAFGLGCAGRF